MIPRAVQKPRSLALVQPPHLSCCTPRCILARQRVALYWSDLLKSGCCPVWRRSRLETIHNRISAWTARVTSRMSLPISMLLAVLGITLTIHAIDNGKEGVLRGILEGRATQNWPDTTTIRVRSGSISMPPNRWWPGHESTAKRYSYMVDGEYYFSSNFDVNGPRFVGTIHEVRSYLRERHHIPVYYDPDDPSNAVLKPGISFDYDTNKYIRIGIIGFVLAVAGSCGVVCHIYAARQKTDRSPRTDP